MTEPLHKGLPVALFASAEEWKAWLGRHGGSSKGLWLRFAKKGSGLASLARSEAIEDAIAHGWIDGQVDRWDERSWLVRFTPRKPRSRWSEINRATAERLVEAGRMTPAGLAEVEAAKRDGRWEQAYPPASRAEVPDDLRAALAAEPAAGAFFAGLTGANRYAVLHRIHGLRTAAGREAAIRRFVAMLARGETVYGPGKASRG